MSNSGTKEWAVVNVNCVTGCSHNCKYCYARKMLVRTAYVKLEDWSKPQIRQWEVDKKRRKIDGMIMFPSSHDICPEMYDGCKTCLENILKVGNEVLIVSKPHLSVIQNLIVDLLPYKSQITFRFTIGVIDEKVRAEWEPGATSFSERVDCLKLAFDNGWKTSVSMEPLLEPTRVFELVSAVENYVSDTIWIGIMSKTKNGIEIPFDLYKPMYDGLNNHPKIRWKDSLKFILDQVIGA